MNLHVNLLIKQSIIQTKDKSRLKTFQPFTENSTFVGVVLITLSGLEFHFTISKFVQKEAFYTV